MVKPYAWGVSEEHKGYDRYCWCDPIGAAYTSWQEASNAQRVLLMLETAIDLAMQGFSLSKMLRAFADVPQFRALGDASDPMCSALSRALVGESLSRISLSGEVLGFEELLTRYGGGEATHDNCV